MVSCRAPPPTPPAETRLTGLEVRSDKFCGLRKRGVVIRLAALPGDVLANRKLPLPSSEVIGPNVPLEARALHTPWMVAKVLLFMRAGLSALPSPPGARLSKAPPGANCGDAISPGFSPAAAAAMAAKLALVGNWAELCSAADSPGDATIT